MSWGVSNAQNPFASSDAGPIGVGGFNFSPGSSFDLTTIVAVSVLGLIFVLAMRGKR